jgi:hypothetical protein
MPKKMNLSKLTMAFATAAPVAAAAPEVDLEAARAMVTQKVAEIKQRKTAATVTSEPKVKAAATVKEPKAPKVAKPTAPAAEGEAKLFTVAGTSTHKGVTKLRFANDLVARIKILNKDGHTDVNLMELPHAMTKAQVVEYFKANPQLGIDSIALANKEDSINHSGASKKSALTTPAE